MKSDLVLDTALLVTSTAYALWLANHKELEPHRTWVEVAVGVGYTLGLTRAESRVWRSFVIAAVPIVAGEIYQELRERAAIAEYRARRAKG